MITAAQQAIIDQALEILSNSLAVGEMLDSSRLVKSFCRLQLGALEHEVFGVLFLNNQHQLITFEEMFRGTVNASAVHPREVVKAALKHNAVAVVFTHNHPSGTTEPSLADRAITSELTKALQLVEVRVLDHIIVSANSTYSFAENGLM